MKKNKSIKKKIIDFYKKSIKKSKLKFNMLETIIIMLIIFGLGLIVGGIVMYGRGSFNGSSMSLNEFISSYNEIVNDYYQEVDKDKLLEAGISGMIRYLGDPYSTYMNSEAASDFTEDVDGTYQGIGAEIKYNDDKRASIGKVFASSPAEKAGLKENDIILKVNDIDVTKKSLSEIASIVKGEKDSSVKLTVLRDGKELTFDIVRAVVDNVSVISEIIEKNNKKIGYIYLSVFASNTTKQFEEELKKLENEKIDSLIIDVRGNSGGYLTTASSIISLFTKKGEVIYQLKTKDKLEIVYDETEESRSYPIIVLTDNSSASASELLVGALSETYGAKIVGTKTYGKGKVQKISTLSSGALFKYTYQEWLTPKGNYIDGVGIKPDVEIKYEYSKEGIDNQKDKAIEVISK